MGKIADIIDKCLTDCGAIYEHHSAEAETAILELVKGCIDEAQPHLVVCLDRFNTKHIIKETKKAIIRNLSNLAKGESNEQE